LTYSTTSKSGPTRKSNVAEKYYECIFLSILTEKRSDLFLALILLILLFFQIISSFSFNANDSNSDWSCTEVSLDIDGQFSGKAIKRMLSYNCSGTLEGPTEYSYSCITVTFKKDDSSLNFKNFQVII